MDKWIDEFGVECNGCVYHTEIIDRSGPVDVALFTGRKHYLKSKKDIIWHEVFTLVDDDAHCRVEFVRATDALGYFAVLHSENKGIKQLCTDEWGICGWMMVQEMVAGHLRKVVDLEQADKISLKVKA